MPAADGSAQARLPSPAFASATGRLTLTGGSRHLVSGRGSTLSLRPASPRPGEFVAASLAARTSPLRRQAPRRQLSRGPPPDAAGRPLLHSRGDSRFAGGRWSPRCRACGRVVTRGSPVGVWSPRCRACGRVVTRGSPVGVWSPRCRACGRVVTRGSPVGVWSPRCRACGRVVTRGSPVGVWSPRCRACGRVVTRGSPVGVGHHAAGWSASRGEAWCGSDHESPRG
jgi:hypothetical protein